jgi:protease-4
VAVVKIHGVIDKVISQFEMECYGGCDLQDIDNALAVVANDERISHVVLDIHSPGGSVVGLKDTAGRIAALRETKEVHAYIAGMAASAGYYLASQADVISAGESAIVGSIGTYIAVLDASRWYEDEGLNMQVLKAGDYKTMGAQWRPLTDEEKSYLQGMVDTCNAEFKAAVTALRAVDDSTMQGQWMNGKQGHDLKLVDGLTNATLDEYVAALIG